MKTYVYHADYADGRKMVHETTAKIREAKRNAVNDAKRDGTEVTRFVKVSEYNT